MRPATPEDVLAFSWLLDTAIAPDGELVAFVRGAAYNEFGKATNYQIWVVPTEGGEARAFTAGSSPDWSPRWSPDGRTLAFLSQREGEQAQIYLLPRDGGEAQRLTEVTSDIGELAWAPDGSKIAMLLPDPVPTEQAQRRKQGDDVVMYEGQHRWSRVWTIDVATREMRQITSGDVQVWEFAWAPDGGFALLTSAEPYEWSWFKPAIAYVGPEGGVPRTIYSAPEKCFTMPRVTPDGSGVAFLAGIWSDRGINAGELLIVPLSGVGEQGSGIRQDKEAGRQGDGETIFHLPSATLLSANYVGSIWWYQFSPDGKQVDFLAYEQGEAAVGQIDLGNNQLTTRWRGEVALGEHHESRYIADDGTIALVQSSATMPQEVWVSRTVDGRGWTEAGGSNRPPSTAHRLNWQQRTNLNTPIAAELAMGEQRTVRWKSTDGQETQGILILPVGYTAGQAVPLITWVHGGPAWLYTHTHYVASRGFQIFAGAGFAVFAPNPRGSNGWGIKFLEQNIGDFGGKDYEDIISGIDYLIGMGIANGERLGIGGWSYGGFMSAWATTQTSRFKAAMVGAAIVNWRSFHGSSILGQWDQVSMRATPYHQGNMYDTRSPISYVEQVITPTLIQHGAADRFVPVEQGYEWFRALKDRGVPVELAVYPRAGHLIYERHHQLDRMRRWLAWFERYLGKG